MAIEKDYSSQGKKIIDEYIEASSLLINKTKNDGAGVYGYASCLIILCAIDAIGQSISGGKYTGSDFSILSSNFMLDDDVVKQIAHWYRNGLSHIGAIPDNIFISIGGEEEEPFVVTGGQVEKINILSLINAVKSLWESKKDKFVPARLKDKPCGFPNFVTPSSTLTEPSSGSTESFATSGCITIFGKHE